MKRILALLAMLVAVSANAQWQPDVRLTNDPADSYASWNNAWCVASNGNNVHVVWYDSRDGNTKIYYKRSSDSGINWGTDTRLTIGIGPSWSPSITVSGSNVHVVWYDSRDGNSEIYYKRSTDDGINWSADTRLTNNPFYSFYPSIAVSGSVIHVVWQDYRDANYEIYYKRSTDGGINWGADTRLSNNVATSEFPSIAVSGSIVHVLWTDRRDGHDEIYYKRSTDGGVNWGTDTRFTNNTYDSRQPSIAVSGSIVHVVYNVIQYKRSTDSGDNWSADVPLLNNAFLGVPSIAVSGSIVHVVWTDARNNYEDIYYIRSLNSGINWETDTRLTNNAANSWYPSIAVSGSNVHVVWQDNRNGNYEIYYKRNPTGNPTGIQNISTETPSAYSLSQNYPNPFNPVTKIRFSIVSSPHVLGGDLVQLKIYDVRGREVQTLVNEQLQPGTYETTFDGSMLNSGVFFYRMITDGFSETKKMLLIK